MGTLLLIKSFALHRQCLNRMNTISFPSYAQFKQILLTFPRCWPINEIKNRIWNSMYTHRTLHPRAHGQVCMPQNESIRVQSWLCHFQLWDLGHAGPLLLSFWFHGYDKNYLLGFVHSWSGIRTDVNVLFLKFKDFQRKKWDVSSENRLISLFQDL